jgi:hypothetical protein
MKKFTVLCLSCFLILAFSAIGYGQEKAPALDFKASGIIYTFGVLNRNIPNGPGSWDSTYGKSNWYGAPYVYGGDAFGNQAMDKTTSFLQTRLRLKFDASMGKEVTGTIQFEADSAKWGEVVPTAGGGNNYAQNNRMGYWMADTTAVEVKNVYVGFGVPFMPVPTTVSVGIQPIFIRPGMFMGCDGPGVVVAIKPDPVFIKLLWAKPLENRIYSADDVDIYGAEMNAKIGDITVGGYGSLKKYGTYPLPAADTDAPNYNANFWWFGVYADGKLGPVNFNYDLSFDNGKIKGQKAYDTYSDVKYSGWATRLKVNYPLDQFNFGVVGMYASGSDTKKTNANGTPGSVTSTGAFSSKNSSYIMVGESGYADSLLYYGSWDTWHSYGYFSADITSVARGEYGGTWFAKLYGSYKATPWYKITLEAMYIGDTTKNGNTTSNAVKADGTLRDDKSIGWEFDLYNQFQIYKNLSFDIAGGLLLAGDAFDYRVGSTNTNKGPANPWMLFSNLTYAF